MTTSAALDGAGILEYVVRGVSTHLDSSRPEDRAQGMLVGEAFARISDHKLGFDDLDDDARAWGAAFVADGTLADGPVHPALRSTPVPQPSPPPPMGGGMLPPEVTKPTRSRGTPRPRRGPDDLVLSGSESDETEDDEDAWVDGDDVDDGFGSDDSSLEAFDIADDGADLAPIAKPVYLRDLLKLLNEKESDEFCRDKHQVALDCAEDLLRSRPADLPDTARDLAHALLNLENRFDLPDFAPRCARATAALAALRPTEVVGEYMCLQFFDRNLTVSKKFEILTAMVDAAFELAGRGSLAGGSLEVPPNLARLESTAAAPARSRRLGDSSAAPMDDAQIVKTRRWGYRRNPREKALPNNFGKIAASTFFFPLLRGCAEHWAKIEKHSSQPKVIKGRVTHALACFLECANTSTSALTLSSHLLAFAWPDVLDEDPALRRVSLAASLTALAHIDHANQGVLALLSGAVVPGLPSADDVAAVARTLATKDPDPTARRLALALQGVVPTAF